MFDSLGFSANHIQGGRIKAPFGDPQKRPPGFPEVPTCQGAAWYGPWATNGTSREVAPPLFLSSSSGGFPVEGHEVPTERLELRSKS